jgi:2-ketocyclohexanecarboxyl-CoA hydrolase
MFDAQLLSFAIINIITNRDDGIQSIVPAAQLDAEVKRWCSEIIEKSPTALAIAKRTMNADTEMFRGIGNLGNLALKLYYGTDEAKSIAMAALKKRKTRGKKKT